MQVITFTDINLLDFGHTIQMYGTIYTGQGKVFFVPFPSQDPQELGDKLSRDSQYLLQLTANEYAAFLQQLDVLDIEAPNKAILRKSQRSIDGQISWNVFKRDGFRCRYCGRDTVPLTVDHVILWEEGGATVEANLISSCRRCNKLRGSMQYEDWIKSADYGRLSVGLTPFALVANMAVVKILPELREIKHSPKSR